MRLISKHNISIGQKEGVAFNYKNFGIDYRIFVLRSEKGFTWEIFKNISSYGNRYETIYLDDETFYKTVEAAKRAAYKSLKLEVE